jgi:hypothetical protein
MHQEPGLAGLERQAEVAEVLIAQRKRTTENRPDHDGMGGETRPSLAYLPRPRSEGYQ